MAIICHQILTLYCILVKNLFVHVFIDSLLAVQMTPRMKQWGATSLSQEVLYVRGGV